MRRFMSLLVLVATTLACTAEAQSVSQPVSQTSEGTSTYSFTVTAGAEGIKDVHVLPKAGQSLDKPPCGEHYTAQPANWSARTSSEGFHFFAGSTGAAIGPGQSATFQLVYVVGTSVLTNRKVNWVLTRNGERLYTSGDVIASGDTGTAPDPTQPNQPFKFPVASIGVSPHPGGSTAIGEVFIAEVAADHSEYAAELLLSLSLLPEGAVDANGQSAGIDTANPPPASWGLAVRGGMRQALERNGHGQFQIAIPADPGLVGLVFYAVVAQDLDHDGVFEVYSAPEMIVITAS
ncbi:MAG: hypothetical protein HY812_01565 [Planctomycetes bacterium]|nr:hypothetical protein [Planctomycetota bacterium]